MKTVNVAELEGVALAMAVAEATERDVSITIEEFAGSVVLICWCEVTGRLWDPTVNWSQGGPLIEALEFGLLKEDDGSWSAIKDMQYAEAIDDYPSGPTPLIAACRAIVAAKFGDTVEVRRSCCDSLRTTASH